MVGVEVFDEAGHLVRSETYDDLEHGLNMAMLELKYAARKFAVGGVSYRVDVHFWREEE